MPRKKKASGKQRKSADGSTPRAETTAGVKVMPYAPLMAVTKRLEVGDPIGHGGMSIIEQAYDTNLLRNVARKILRPEHAAAETVCGRLIEEAQITAQLDHPNIVPVYELGVDKKDSLYFTMKLVKGKTFSEIIMQQDYHLRSEKELFSQLQIFLKVCDAVAFAHDRGVIHQDLKPDNIMVGEFGEVYLMDWGFAMLKPGSPAAEACESTSTGKKKTASKRGKRREYNIAHEDGIVATTIYYMAPEQTRGQIEAIDERTDIFCLGGILYKILTQKPPHFGDSLKDVAKSAIRGTVKPPEEVVDVDLPARLTRICMKALTLNPKKRYQTVAELKEDVEGFLQCGWQFDRRQFPAGCVIVKEGDPGDVAYIITTGRCCVFKTVNGEKSILGEIGVGDVFGELAVFAKQPRGASVEALEPVTVMVVTRKHFEEDLGMSFWLGLFVKTLAERFLESSRRITDLELQLKKLEGSDA